MFERFLETFNVSDGDPISDSSGPTDVEEWAKVVGGRTFDDGLYRVHTTRSAAAANSLVRAAFPEFAGRLSCFGYDWLGRQFATDAARGLGSDPEVLLFEPGTGQALEIPVPFSAFHDELIDFDEAALARSFYEQWRADGGAAPTLDECVGYRTPLFLGGQDDVSNLEVSDLDVYWTIMGQLRVQILNRAEGTRISAISSEE